MAYRVALANLGVAERPTAAPRVASLTWLGRFRMFTELRDQHVVFEAEARGAGGWSPIDLAAIFPSHRDEGPGYQRDDLYRDPRRLDALGRALCDRLDTPAVRFSVRRWPKTLGRVEQPQSGVSVEPLSERSCR